MLSNRTSINKLKMNRVEKIAVRSCYVIQLGYDWGLTFGYPPWEGPLSFLWREAIASVCVLLLYVNNLYTNQLRRIDYEYSDSEKQTSTDQTNHIAAEKKGRKEQSNLYRITQQELGFGITYP